MGRVESLTADISMASAAARPANIVKPQRMRERAEGGDTGIRAGTEDLSVSVQMEESGNTDIIAMRVKEEKREECDTVPGSEFSLNYPLKKNFFLINALDGRIAFCCLLYPGMVMAPLSLPPVPFRRLCPGKTVSTARTWTMP